MSIDAKKHIRLVLVMLLIAASSAALAQGIRSSLTDQVIINTQRLSDLERRMYNVETGGSSLAMDSAARITLLNDRILNQQREIEQLKSVLLGVAIFIITHLVGFVIYMLKRRFVEPQGSHISMP
jgi:hypothetical protein